MTMTMLGRYRIDTKIGDGAMADVYRGYDESIDRPVAIKVLKEELARDPELSVRFLREARAAGALNHPNIATIYDVGVVEGVPYIAMELIEGQTLDLALQSQGRFPYERVLELGLQLASALEYAHRAGIVHRDIKPSNVLLTADGRTAKLLDFGVARIDGAGEDLAKTRFGQLIGTPRYMSPEQALGAPLDHRSDFFSLGVVLYELTTGKVAFPGTTLATLAIKIAQEGVEPIERSAADCPRGMSFIIDKLLAKKPEQRFQSADALCDALKRELATRQELPTRRGLPLRLKLLLLMASVTAVALAGSISAILDRQERTLQRVAIASGTSISDFVTRNSGVLFAENAGLPSSEQDWTTLQAYVASAANDPEIRSMIVADSSGIIRAAYDKRLLGQPYRAAQGERQVEYAETGSTSGMNALVVTEAPDRGQGSGLRFVRPVQYAGADFGSVDIVLSRAALDSAIAATRTMLLVLALIIMAVVAAVGFLSGAMVTRPLARLTKALRDAADSSFALRISHHRRDEFGEAFEAFNAAAAVVEPRLNGGPVTEEVDPQLTRIVASPRRAA